SSFVALLFKQINQSIVQFTDFDTEFGDQIAFHAICAIWIFHDSSLLLSFIFSISIPLFSAVLNHFYGKMRHTAQKTAIIMLHDKNIHYSISHKEDCPMAFDAIIIGASIIDLPAGPVDASVFQSGSHPVERLAFQVGGDAINEATVLSYLGHNIKLISKIGSDLGGRFIQEHCDRNGINRDSFVTDPSMDTGINIVLIEPD